VVVLVKQLPPVRIWPIYKEDYGAQYGKKRLPISYEGKKVLDVGADVGSTADFFLRRGAREVIAVEGNNTHYLKLQENAKRIPGIRPVFLCINDPRHYEALITRHRPDVLKADCEGCEKHLFQISDAVFRMVPEYVIETHDFPIFKAMMRKCQRCKYRVVDVNWWCSEVRIVYTVRL